MTVSELYRSVAQLGFEDNLEDDDRFLYAANRALLQVNALRPATSVCIINHRPMKNKVQGASFAPVLKTEDLCFEATDVKSFYFEVDGAGRALIERYDEASGEWSGIGHVDFEGGASFLAYRGFIRVDGEYVGGRVRLRFIGDYLYSVKNVAMYEHLLGPSDEEIPAFEPYTRYDVGALATDFLTLCSPPIKEDAERRWLNQGYDVENGRVILLPHDAEGLYQVQYHRLPHAIESVEEGEALIDLDEELCSLLPILVASFVWVDDEPEKAQYYLAIYQGRAADIERRRISCAPVSIKTNGW